MENKHFNDYVEDYLASKESQLSMMSYHHYSLLIHKHIVPFFDHVFIYDLNKEVMHSFLASLKMEESSKNVLKSIMKSILEYIYQEGINNVIELIPLFVQNTATKEKVVLSHEEEKILRNYCMNHLDEYTLSILIVLDCGLKVSELCALKVEDLKDHQLHIHTQVQRISNSLKNDSKTKVELFELEDVSHRYIPIPDDLYTLLQSYNSEMNTFLLSKKKKIKGARIYQIHLKRISEYMDFHFNYNTLRETFKENCIEANMNIYTLMEILGVRHLSFHYKQQYRVD